MPTVSHATLTGADLHEPKGIASASSNTVYVANGAGSGTWTALAGVAGAFGNRLLIASYTLASGSNGGTFTAGSYQTTALNTLELNEISGASLTSNQITLPSGTYFAVWETTGYGVEAHTSRLRNVTDGTTLIKGTSNYSKVGAASNLTSGAGRFTLGGTKAIELQQYCTQTYATYGFGLANGSGENELYARILIWKIG